VAEAIHNEEAAHRRNLVARVADDKRCAALDAALAAEKIYRRRLKPVIAKRRNRAGRKAAREANRMLGGFRSN
jgi:hypothetical protein